jgi:carbonic anhydrase
MHRNGWINRRDFLKWTVIGTSSLTATASNGLGSMPVAHAALASQKDSQLSPEAALQALLAGNQRFVDNRLKHPHQSKSRLKEVAQGQHPFATILSCADSRVPSEIIFDQGIGDLFDVRIAGNIATLEAIGSIEYAALELATPLILILGHKRCGAITAAVQKGALPGQIRSLVKAIQPALIGMSDQSGDAIDNAVIANVRYQVSRLKHLSIPLNQRMATGTLKILGGYYDLDSGKVTILN